MRGEPTTRRLCRLFVGLSFAMMAAPAVAARPPLPIVPKMVMELYLPEEQAACRSGYAIYTDLGDEPRAKLHGGAKYPIAAAKLSPATRTRLAAWFDSARWGCDPPGEKLDAETVAKSTLLLTHEDGVVELALQSPVKSIRKKLTVACPPEKAQWVRGGLPLLPYWALVSWEGGCRPPVPGPMAGRGDLFLVPKWQMLRALYSVYAGLSPVERRRLHTAHSLAVSFGSLSPERQDAIAAAVDYGRLCANKSFGVPLDTGRPPDARRRHFDITQVSFTYGRNAPDAELASIALGTNMEGIDACPRPYRSVIATLDTRYPPAPKSHPKLWRHEFSMVACPAELQHSLLVWRSEFSAWQSRWEAADGLGWKPGAPPYPRHPE